MAPNFYKSGSQRRTQVNAEWVAQHAMIMRMSSHSPSRSPDLVYVHRHMIDVEFGDCDPAKIVWYPNYFGWFDACTTALFKSVGLPLPELFRSLDVVGIPIVDASAKFLRPSSYGQEITAESSIVEYGRSSFRLQHRFYRDGELLVDGGETRVWVRHHPTEAGRLMSVPFPEVVRERFREFAHAQSADRTK
jgi:4-hydroxybenzoyl-CoA thioesterase